MIELLFWLSVIVLAYIYVGYPFVIALIASICRREVARAPIYPKITVVIAAFNEEAGIAAKIRNVLELDYPSDKLDVIVASDASSDRTDDIVRVCGAPNVRLHRVEGRVGKTACQNSAVTVAVGDLVVFTDATTVLARDCVRYLAENFADPHVGCVAGALQYVAAGSSATAHGGTAYWDYELRLRLAESAAGGLIGVSGCLYAVRKVAYLPIRPDLISDFCIAMRMRSQGLRTVLDARAVCSEDTLTDVQHELAMRVRVAVRSLHALRSELTFLNPFKYGLFAFELISHKLLRYLSPLIWAIALATNTWLAKEPLYELLLACQLLVIGVGASGFLFRDSLGTVKVLVKPYYFVLTNVASLAALWKVLRGERIVTWRPIR